MSKPSITILFQGNSHAGKGCAMAAIAHYLQSNGVDVVVQSADSHNKEKLSRPDNELLARLHGTQVILMEQQTGR